MINANGLTKLGIENCKPIFTRGISSTSRQ